tara:strand:- start:691 stop:2139 length:1449 start_codon:yes stop_codon:yes gene_type:complete
MIRLIKTIIFILYSSIFSQVYDGNVLFTPYYSNSPDETITYYMNNNYEIINSWSHEDVPASMAYLLPDSSILYPFKVDNPTMFAGGVGGGLRKISWDGDVYWEYIFSDNTYQHHHDVEPLPNGNILILVWEKKTEQEASALGRENIQNFLGEMWSEAILELDSSNGEIIWQWHLWDHLVQDVNPSLPNYGNISSHPELFDINCGNVGLNAGGPQQENADWMHLNSVHYNDQLDQIILSSRTQNEIYVIDHSTTTQEAASHIGGDSGKGGDILYRWGNPQNYGRGNDSHAILAGQHSVNWIPDGYPGEGNIILFNNMHSNSSSAIIEISTPIDSDGKYIIEDGEPFGPFDYEWIYNLGEIIPMQGGSYRLSNGNTIISKTHLAEIIEVNQFGEIVWQYTHELDQVSLSFWIARCKKYSLDYLESLTLGDINGDGIANVLDIVALVNIILYDSGDVNNADVNNDGIINILDVVLMVTVILNGPP